MCENCKKQCDHRSDSVIGCGSWDPKEIDREGKLIIPLDNGVYLIV
jgi:hypothetical protein